MTDSTHPHGPRARGLVLLFFLALGALGLGLVEDYGVSWDEPYQRQLGHDLLDFVAHGDPRLLQNRDRYYGPVVELPLAALERALGLEDSRAVYLLRHALSFAVFVLAAWWLYRLGALLAGDWRWGLLAAACLVLSPRLFADAFYNTKDIPFLAFFTGSMLTLARLLRRPSWGRVVAHAALCALAVDTRVAGLMTVAITVLLCAPLLVGAGPAERGRLAGRLAAMLGLTGVLVVALWPLLWSEPLGRFSAALVQASKYPWPWTVLYRGEFVPAAELPWHYIPVWLGITTPPSYLVAALAGLLAAVPAALRGLRARPRAFERLIPLAWLGVPLAALWIQRPVVYDAWRHFFFIYPAVVLLAVTGLRWLVAAADRTGRRWARGAVALLFGASLLQVAAFMALAHPHQNVYFNAAVAPPDRRARYELDYWGTSYRRGFEYVLATDPRPSIRVFADTEPGWSNLGILPAADRGRLTMVGDWRQADYVLTTFRWRPAGYPLPQVYSVVVGGATILAVYRGPATPVAPATAGSDAA